MDRDGWNARYAGLEYVWNVQPSALLMGEVRNLAPGRALDLGCGEGRNSVWLATLGWRVTGVDFSVAGLEKARALARRHEVRVRWLLRDVLAYKPRPGHYDLVLMCYLQLPHDELAHVVRLAARALVPGGTFLCIAHDLINLEHGHGGPRDPAVLRTPDEVVAMLPGIDVTRAEVVARAVDAEPGHGGAAGAVARDNIVVAVRPALPAGTGS